MLAAGFSKARSSLLAFVAVPPRLKQFLKVMVPTYVYGGPVPVAALATRLLGLEVNQRRGDELRAQLHQRTRNVLDHLDKLGVATSNVSDFPIVELALADAEDLFPLLAVLGEVDDRFGSAAPPLRRSLGGLADFVRLLEFRT